MKNKENEAAAGTLKLYSTQKFALNRSGKREATLIDVNERARNEGLSQQEIFKHFNIQYPPKPNCHAGICNLERGAMQEVLGCILRLYPLNKKVRIILHYDPDFPRMAYEVIGNGDG